MQREAILNQLMAMRSECEAAILDQAGGASVCQIHKDGRVTGGMKYQEGRLVVLGEIIRRIKGLAEFNTDAVQAILAAECEKWRSQLDHHQTQEKPAMTWVAYAQGGTDALSEIEQFVLRVMT